MKALNKNTLMLDFSNTITTVASEDNALKNYLEFVANTEGIIDDELFNKFTNLRSIKLIDRETNFRTFVEINREVWKELYNVDNIHEDDYYRFHESLLKLKDDFIPFIESIKNNANVVLVTDADNIYTYRTLDALGIRKYFDFIITAEDVLKPKPLPEIFNKAISLCNGSKLFWHIGDSERRDIGGAKKLGIYAVLMADDFKETAADATVKNFTELRKLMIEKRFLNY